MEKLLNDRFELSSSRDSNNNVTTSTQLRDLALATLIEMTQQDPTVYAMKAFSRAPNGRRLVGFPVGFETEEQRDAAIQQWHVWSVLHLRKFRAMSSHAEEGTRL